MTAVAVWNKKPDANEILQERIKRGWKPTASALQDGDKFLGFAACLVKEN